MSSKKNWNNLEIKVTYYSYEDVITASLEAMDNGVNDRDWTGAFTQGGIEQ